MLSYASHVLTKAERKWSTYDRELWAIVWSVRHFRHHLYKQPFTIITDHKPLMGLRKIPIDNDRTGRRARWALELDPFEWTVMHREGHSHSNADALSRRPDDMSQQSPSPSCPLVPAPTSKTSCLSHENCPRHSHSKHVDPPVVSGMPPQSKLDSHGPAEFTLSTFVFPVSEGDLKNEQQKDSVLSEVISWKMTGRRPPYWRM